MANDDSYSMNQDATLNVPAPGVLGNDTDADPGDALNSTVVTFPANGTLAPNADGSFMYTPNPGFTGVDTFTYKADDGTTDSNVATVIITVADTQGPNLTSSVAATSLWPPNHDLVNVGLTASATDTCRRRQRSLTASPTARPPQATSPSATAQWSDPNSEQ